MDHLPGADPGISVKWGVGGVWFQPSENFDKRKKRQKWERKGGGLQYLFCFDMVEWLKSIFAIKYDILVKCVSDVTFGGVALVLPQNFLV